MKLPRRNFLHLAAGAAALPAIGRVACAETYPARPIRRSLSGRRSQAPGRALRMALHSKTRPCDRGRCLARVPKMHFAQGWADVHGRQPQAEAFSEAEKLKC
jgi:hypothetical protein